MTKLPPPPPQTAAEIIGHLRDYWIENIGTNQSEAAVRAERGFQHLLAVGGLREWGFNEHGHLLYESHTPAVSETIVYVLIRKENG